MYKTMKYVYCASSKLNVITELPTHAYKVIIHLIITPDTNNKYILINTRGDHRLAFVQTNGLDHKINIQMIHKHMDTTSAHYDDVIKC